MGETYELSLLDVARVRCLEHLTWSCTWMCHVTVQAPVTASLIGGEPGQCFSGGRHILTNKHTSSSL